MSGLHIGGHPLPEGQRLSVRVVDTEQRYAFRYPEQHDVAERLPQLWNRGRRIEVDIDDVLVLLGRVLGVLDGAVWSALEPVGMLRQPWMVRGALDGEVQCD